MQNKKNEKDMRKLPEEISADRIKQNAGPSSTAKNVIASTEAKNKPGEAAPANIPQKEKKKKRKEKITSFKLFVYFLVIALLLTATYFYLTKNATNSFLIFSGAIILSVTYLAMRKRMQRYQEIKKMELVFPDFISLMSSNLRAGMTIDQALILSARKEFAPLDKEILKVGKDILTAREISLALYDMGERIGSDEIRKTIQLLISGIRSGGNLSILLEQTSNNMRERGFVKKRAASNVLMYVIFIFFAVAVGAPLLFALSSILVEIMTSIFKDIPTSDVNMNLPFNLSSINISLDFIIYFSTAFIIVSSILASLILGLVSKGDEREGLKYTIPLMAIGLAVFFLSRFFLAKYFVNLFG